MKKCPTMLPFALKSQNNIKVAALLSKTSENNLLMMLSRQLEECLQYLF